MSVIEHYGSKLPHLLHTRTNTTIIMYINVLTTPSFCVCMYVCEQQLERSLQQFGERWEMNPGDGAFYGPKVSVRANMRMRKQDTEYKS